MWRKLKAFSIPIPVKSWFHPESSNFSLSSSKASHLERGFRVKNSFLSLWSWPKEILLLLSFQLLFSSQSYNKATTSVKATEDDFDAACSWFTLDRQLTGNCHTARAPIKLYSPTSLLFNSFPLTSPSQQCLPAPSPAPSTQQTRQVSSYFL